MNLTLVKIAQAAIVPTCDPNAPVGSANVCGKEKFFELVHNIIEFGIYLSGLAVTVAIIYGAFMYMVSAGEMERVSKAHRAIKAAIVGLVIVLSAWVITNTVTTLLVPNCTNWNIFRSGAVCTES